VKRARLILVSVIIAVTLLFAIHPAPTWAEDGQGTTTKKNDPPPPPPPPWWLILIFW
jgi:hypothetical protein